MQPIGVVHSPFKEKFGIPRQPGLAPLAQADLELFSPYDSPDAVEGLEGCSHLWVVFLFHRGHAGWSPKVRPPRLGGNRKVGVFATRSPRRPNPIGLSVVRLLECRPGRLRLAGVDLLDQTPVLDLKPYVPYVDRVDDASNALAQDPPEPLRVEFSDEAQRSCLARTQSLGLPLDQLVVQLLSQDPRPAYQQLDSERVYGMRLFDFDLRFRFPEPGKVYVQELVNCTE